MARALFVFSVILLAACGASDSMMSPSEPGTPVSIVLSPANGDLTFRDETLRLDAEARDADGIPVSGVSFTWSSSDPSVVSVDQTGLVTAVAGGSAEVTAQAEGLSARATIRVTGPSNLSFLHASWTGTAVVYGAMGADTLEVTGRGQSVVSGQGTRLALVVGNGPDAREIVALGNARDREVYLGLADGYRGTFAVSNGFFDSRGSLSIDSGTRLGNGWVERVRMADFRTTSFRLYVDVSTDGGASWSPVWAFELEKGGAGSVSPTDASPACTAEHYSDFNFWRGSWNVTQGGQPAGSDLIRPMASMCGIEEDWTSTGGGTGLSLNMFDARSGKWTQMWVDSGGLVLDITGGLAGGAMVLEGPRVRNENTVDRVTWGLNDDGTVSQTWESNSGGQGWTVTFAGRYTPAG